MKVWKTISAALAVMVAGALAANAATVSATVSTGEPGYGTALPAGANWFTPPSIVAGSVTGSYISPFNDTTSNFYTVGSLAPLVQSPVVLVLGAATNAFKLLWGTVDTNNAIFLVSGNSVVDQVYGQNVLTALSNPASGSTGAKVSFTSTFSFDTIVFVSNLFSSPYNPSDADKAAFEFALAPVPLPAAGLLLVAAVGGLAAVRRRKTA